MNKEKYITGNKYDIDIEKIINNPDQPRKYFDNKAINDLSKSIEEEGILNPLLVRWVDNQIILVAGERRLRAAQKASVSKVPVIFIDKDPSVVSLIENLQREDLNPIEEAESLQRLKEERNYTQNQLITIVGKAKATISEILKINELPDDIKDE